MRSLSKAREIGVGCGHSGPHAGISKYWGRGSHPVCNGGRGGGREGRRMANGVAPDLPLAPQPCGRARNQLRPPLVTLFAPAPHVPADRPIRAQRSFGQAGIGRRSASDRLERVCGLGSVAPPPLRPPQPTRSAPSPPGADLSVLRPRTSSMEVGTNMDTDQDLVCRARRR